jgi:hypothetical protein
MTPKAQSEDDTIVPTETRSPAKLDRFANYMTNRATQDKSDNPKGMDSILERMLTVDDEDIWDSDEGGVPAAKDMVNIEHRIFGFDIYESKDAEISNKSLGNTYLIVHAARLDTGEEYDYNTSAPLLVVKLVRLFQADKLPVNAVIRATDLGGGKMVLKYRPVPTRAI